MKKLFTGCSRLLSWPAKLPEVREGERIPFGTGARQCFRSFQSSFATTLFFLIYLLIVSSSPLPHAYQFSGKRSQEAVLTVTTIHFLLFWLLEMNSCSFSAGSSVEAENHNHLISRYCWVPIPIRSSSPSSSSG